MSRTTLDLWVGFFVATGMVALMFLAMKVGNLTVSSAGETYPVIAHFDNVGALKVRSAVKSAGVVVGRVAEIHFNAQSFQADVTLAMDARFKFPIDTFATINTSGLLGEQYVGFEVGGEEKMLAPGDTLKKTQSAVVLEKLISKFMFNKASEPDAAK